MLQRSDRMQEFQTPPTFASEEPSDLKQVAFNQHICQLKTLCLDEHLGIVNFVETEIGSMLRNEGMDPLGRKRAASAQVGPFVAEQ